MYNILLRTLGDAIFSQAGELKDNNLAKQLYMLLQRDYSDSLRKLQGEAYIEFIGKLRGLPNDCPADLSRWQKDEDDSTLRDYRFVNLFLHGMRRYAIQEDEWPLNPQYFSVSFADKDRNPKSTVLLGSNGVGKSTIFNALEYAVLNHIPSAEIKDIFDFEDYLQHKNDETVIWEVGLDTKDIWQYKVSEKRRNSTKCSGDKAIGVSAVFCHQGDVVVLERSESLRDYLYDQLGLGFYYQLLSLLTELLDKEREGWRDYQGYKERIEKLSSTLEGIRLFLIKDCPEGVEALARLNTNVDNQCYFLLEEDCYGRMNEIEELANNLGRYIDKEAPLKNKLYDSELIHYMEELTVLIWQLNELQKTDIEIRNPNDELEVWGDILAKLRLYEDGKLKIRSIVEEIGEINSHELVDWFLDIIVEKQKREGELLKEYRLSDGTSVKDPFIRIEEHTANSFKLWEDEMRELVAFLQKDFRKLAERLKNEWLEPVVKTLTEPYFHDIGKVDLKFDNFKLELNILLEPNSNSYPIKSVLNTFRLKVFTISLKCALAYCTMQLYNITLPIIVDDIFDSSDFSHRATIDKYFTEMIKKYNSINKDRRPLQLIFLTQDELIAEGIVRGIKSETGQDNVMIQRLVDPDFSVNNRFEVYQISNSKKWIIHRPLSIVIC